MIAKKDIEPPNRASIIRACNPISIRVSIQVVEVRLFGKEKAIIYGRFQITNDEFNICPIRDFKIMYQLTDLVHRDYDVRLG